MKIWLDDIRPAPAGFIHVRNLAELKELIGSNQDAVEVMDFDHDLGDGEPDGYEIIKWFAREHLARWPLEVAVHSGNGPGGDNIGAFASNIQENMETLLERFKHGEPLFY